MEIPVEKQDEHSLEVHKFDEPSPHKKQSKKGIIKKFLIVFIILIILTGGGFTALKLTSSKDRQDSNSSQVGPQVTRNDTSSENANLSESFESEFLLVNIKYPNGWEAREENDAIIITSPSFQYEEKSGDSADGFFRIYIKRGATDTDGKYLGRGYAISDSEKINYSQPANGQRKDTYLTNFGLDTPDNFAYFVVQGNFNLKKGDTLGPKFAHEPSAFLIAGGFSSDDNKEPLATNILSADSFAVEANYKTALEIIKSIQIR